MGQHAEIALALARCIGSTAQRGAEQTLMPREGAFRLPALAILPPVEPSFHLPSVLRPRPLAALAATVDRDDSRAHPQIFATQAMMLFAIEGGVAEDAVPTNEHACLFQSRGELGGIIARTRADGRRRPEVAGGVADDGELRPRAGRAFLAGSNEEVTGGVATVQARGINGCFGPLVDQAALLRAHGGHDEEESGLPFFKSRCSALQRVEKCGSLFRPRSSRNSRKSTSICTRPR